MSDKYTMSVLNRILSKICKLEDNTDELEALVAALNNLATGTVLVEGYNEIGPGNVGIIGAGSKAYSIENTGSSSALVNGNNFPVGAYAEFGGDKGDTFTGQSYDTQLTTLGITIVM